MFDDWTDEYVVNEQQEYEMFIDWCATCFEWEKYKPTKQDWTFIRENWYPGQAPADAVKRVIKA